jgi:hypothetical protein
LFVLPSYLHIINIIETNIIYPARYQRGVYTAATRYYTAMIVTLISEDKQEFRVDRKVAEMSMTIKNLLDGMTRQYKHANTATDATDATDATVLLGRWCT